MSAAAPGRARPAPRWATRSQFIGVNVAVNQSPERVRRYLESSEPPFRALYDDQGASTRAYRGAATSYVVIVDRARQVAYTGVGGDQQFIEALRRVAAAMITLCHEVRWPCMCD